MLSTCRAVTRLSFRRTLTTEAAAIPQQQQQQQLTSSARPKLSPRPRISTAVVLNRSPILTRTPTSFELAFYAYEQRIRRAISNPFPHDFYFKQGSLLETRFNMEERKRERRAFGPGFLPKETTSEEERAANEAAVEQLAQQEGEGEDLMPRRHEVDEKKDVTSLDRQGERNLYLLVKAVEDGKEVWRFPQGQGIEKSQALHQVAQTDLFAECGDHMDTWIVGRTPIGVYEPPSSQDPNYVFLFKGHIMAGQVKPDGKRILDFAWLTKEEIQPRVSPHYWQGIKDVLSDF